MKNFLLGVLVTIMAVILLAAEGSAPGLRVNGQSAFELNFAPGDFSAYCDSAGRCQIYLIKK